MPISTYLDADAMSHTGMSTDSGVKQSNGVSTMTLARIAFSPMALAYEGALSAGVN